MSDHELQLALRALGVRLEDEPTADVAAAVVGRLGAPASAHRRRVRPLLLAAAMVLIAAAAAVAASDTVRGWLSGHGVSVHRVEHLPPTASVTGIADLGAGRPTDPATAARALGGALPRSARLGPPASVLLATTPAGPAVTLVWRPRRDLPAAPQVPGVGALLTVGPLRDQNDPMLIGKSLGPRSGLRFVTIPGIGEGVWIAGAPHAVRLFDGSEEHFRLAANALLWAAGSRIYRLEGALGEGDALAVAQTIR